MNLFRPDHMQSILECAIGCERSKSGEYGVYLNLLEANHSNSRFTQRQLQIIQYCAEECRRQKSGPRSVYWMLCAWYEATTRSLASGRIFAESDILELGAIVEPFANGRGYRTVPVHFTNGTVLGWQNIPRQMETLVEAQSRLSVEELAANEFYEQFERIHPLLDGNGRLGKILFNWRNATLLSPEFPLEPNFELRLQ